MNRLHGYYFFQSFHHLDSENLCLTLQIIFEAIRGVSIRSDTAIDDILFQAGPCLGKFQDTLLETPEIHSACLWVGDISLESPFQFNIKQRLVQNFYYLIGCEIILRISTSKVAVNFLKNT